MSNEKWLNSELSEAERQIAAGQAPLALRRLKFVLKSYSADDPQVSVSRARILQSMGKAAATLGDAEAAERLFGIGLDVLNSCKFETNFEKTEYYMALAEHYAACGLPGKARVFADAALRHAMESGSSDPDTEETAELLRRYAWVAEKSGAIGTAYLALSLGLLILHQVSGVDSTVAESLAELANRVCDVDSPQTIQQVGKHALRIIKERSRNSSVSSLAS